MTETTATRVTLRCQFCHTWNRVDASRVADRPKCGKCSRPMLLDRPVPLTEDTFERTIRESDVPVLVDFYADWCGPCRVMAPQLDAFARRHAGAVLVAKVDTDRNPAISQHHGIRSIPTLIAFGGGREVGREIGVVPPPRMDALVARARG